MRLASQSPLRFVTFKTSTKTSGAAEFQNIEQIYTPTYIQFSLPLVSRFFYFFSFIFLSSSHFISLSLILSFLHNLSRFLSLPPLFSVSLSLSYSLFLILFPLTYSLPNLSLSLSHVHSFLSAHLSPHILSLSHFPLSLSHSLPLSCMFSLRLSFSLPHSLSFSRSITFPFFSIIPCFCHSLSLSLSLSYYLSLTSILFFLFISLLVFCHIFSIPLPFSLSLSLSLSRMFSLRLLFSLPHSLSFSFFLSLFLSLSLTHIPFPSIIPCFYLSFSRIFSSIAEINFNSFTIKLCIVSINILYTFCLNEILWGLYIYKSFFLPPHFFLLNSALLLFLKKHWILNSLKQ